MEEGGGLLLERLVETGQAGLLRYRFGRHGDHFDAGLLEQLHRRLGCIGVGNHGGDPVQAAQDQASLLGELGAVGQYDQFFGLADQALFGLDQQRVRFHQPQQRQAVHAHEHLGGVVVLGNVVLERAQDDVLLAVDGAARQNDFILARYQQPLGHQKGIGENLQVGVDQELGHHESCRAAVDDDRFAIDAHAAGAAGDGALALGETLDVVLKGFAGQGEAAFFLFQVFGAAAGTGQQIARGQPADVAPHGGGRSAEPVDQLGNACCSMLGEQLQQTLAAFVIHHGVLSPGFAVFAAAADSHSK